MSGDVIDFESRRVVRTPHRCGEARCLNCKHEWAATAPNGTVYLECPQCSTFQGVFKGLSQTEHCQWRCGCGEYAYFIDTLGPYCCHCGMRPDFHWTPPRAS